MVVLHLERKIVRSVSLLVKDNFKRPASGATAAKGKYNLVHFVCKMCSCPKSNESCHFSSEKRWPPKIGFWFSSGKRHIPKKNLGNRRGLRRKSYNKNGKLWESSRILRVKTKPWKYSEISQCFFNFPSFDVFVKFLHISSFFMLIHFPSFSWFFFVFFIFVQFSSCFSSLSMIFVDSHIFLMFFIFFLFHHFSLVFVIFPHWWSFFLMFVHVFHVFFFFFFILNMFFCFFSSLHFCSHSMFNFLNFFFLVYFLDFSFLFSFFTLFHFFCFSSSVECFGIFFFFFFFLFQSSEQTPKPAKKSSRGSYCKKDDFLLWKFDFWASVDREG